MLGKYKIAYDVLYKRSCTLWVVALLGVMTSFKMVAILAAILDFAQNELLKKRGKLRIVLC